jgi:hypothetical protein
MFSMRSFLQYLSMTGRRRWSRVFENVFSKPLQKSRRATRLYWRPRQPKWARSRKREQARLLPNRKMVRAGPLQICNNDHSGSDSLASEKIGCTGTRCGQTQHQHEQVAEVQIQRQRAHDGLAAGEKRIIVPVINLQNLRKRPLLARGLTDNAVLQRAGPNIIISIGCHENCRESHDLNP